MKENRIIVLLFVLGGFILSNGKSHAQTVFSDFIVFGDSLSDTGNINSGLPDLPPPFYENRISNGFVVVDHVAESIGFNATASERGGNNYAVAGGNILGSDREDFTAQVDDYLSDVQNKADPLALYFILIGGNDLRDLRGETVLASAQARIDEIVSVYIQQVNRLSYAGARRFVVANVPDVGRIPETMMKEEADPGIGARASNYTQIFNIKISQALDLLSQQQNVAIAQFETFSEFSKILDSPGSYGFTYTTFGCVDISSENILDLLVSIIFPYAPECLAGIRFDEFVFFDNLHPGEATNQIIGERMVEFVAGSNFEPPNPPNTSGVAAIVAAIMMLLFED